MKLNPKNGEVLDRYSWKQDFILMTDKELQTQEKLMLKDKDYQFSKDLFIYFHNLDLLQSLNRFSSRRLMALVWFGFPKQHRSLDPYFDTIPLKDWYEVEKSLLSLKPKNSFWFNGQGWDNEDRRFKLRSFFPLVVKMVKEECQSKSFVRLNEKKCSAIKLN